MVSAPALIALDWGSSSLRAFLMDAAGGVLAERASEDGASRLTGGASAFEQALRALAGEWLAAWPRIPVWACGMVGSQHGWREAPYANCPVALSELHRAAVVAEGTDALRVHIVPGVSWRGDDDADVMRGEEIQVAGLLAAEPMLAARCRVVLPGTHSKWVEVRDGRIVSFRTFMTGELFAVLRQHSVLGRLMPAPGGFHAEGFDAGLARAREDAGSALSGHLFSARARVLLGQLPAEAAADYLSGILVGHELAGALPRVASDEPLALAGDAALCARYVRALQAWGRPPATVAGNTAPRGLWLQAMQAAA